jgi:two-component system cell cycle response regulator
LAATNLAQKVLIADDSPLVLRMIEKMLTGAGFSVVTARDGLEAIEKTVSEDVQLVILDVTMPRLNGYQACRLLKSEASTRDLPVVILTSRDQAGDRYWGLETGADFYITKDAEPQRIVDLVRGILGGAKDARRPEGAKRSSMDILSRVNELLDRRLYEATILSEIGRVARSLVRFDETFISVMALIARVVDFSMGGMAFIEGDDMEAFLLQQRNVGHSVVDEMKGKLREAVLQGRGGAALGRMQARLFTPAAGPAGAEEAALDGFLAVPIATGDRLVGLLALGGRQVAPGHVPDAFLQQVAGQAHIVMQNSRLFERVQQLAIRDSLTDVFNHRHAVDLLQQEVLRVARYREGDLSVLMLDIDHFKNINDELGHLAGDAVLREMARLLREGLRSVDSVGRYGGEEFVLILPQTRHEEARQTAERLRQQIEQHAFKTAEQLTRITVSVGVATFPSENVDSAATLLREADEALYRAKEQGRNRVM